MTESLETPDEAQPANSGIVQRMRAAWDRFYQNHTGTAQFLMFFIISNGVTVLQLALMPIFRWLFSFTPLVDIDFQVWPVGSNPDGSQFYIFDYAAGDLPLGSGGLAYFLAVQITIAIAQILNFFMQRSVAFRSNSSIWWAAMWYFIAYVIITIAAAAAQGFYRTPIYTFFIDTLEWGSTGETTADVITMIINAAISFWVFFPIFKVIFRQVPEAGETEVTDMIEKNPIMPTAVVAAKATDAEDAVEGEDIDEEAPEKHQ